MSEALKAACAAATKKVGHELVACLANVFGSTNGTIDDVPAARRAGLTAALNRLIHGEGRISMALARAAAHGDAKPKRRDDQEDVFRAIRAEAFGTQDDDEKPAAEINPREIYARWNASKRPNED